MADGALMFASQVCPLLVLILGLLIVPESPRWLVAKGHSERALAVLRRINGPDRARQELEEIIQDVNASASASRSAAPILPQAAAARHHPDDVLAGQRREHDAAVRPHHSERRRDIVRLALGAVRIAGLCVIFISTLMSFPLIHRYSRRGILIASTSVWRPATC